MAIWTPELSERRGPKYLQIAEALSDDIGSGALAPGTQLPPHRELAYALGLSPNTTSRAYAEGVARAFLRGEVGRGTFVRGPGEPKPHGRQADMTRPSTGPIELSRNLPARGFAAVHLAATLGELQNAEGLEALLDYQTDGELGVHNEAVCEWIARCGLAARPDEVVTTNGTQHGVLATLMAITRPGDLLLAEELTYAPVKAMAEALGLKLLGVPMDEQGLCPDQLDRICRTHAAKALYFTPTLQTPTTITLNKERRMALAETARRHGILMIEDDVFAQINPEGPVPVATHAPEQTIYLTSTSKCLAPGLRVGFIRAPSNLVSSIRGAVNLSCWMTPPLMLQIAARWITDGTAERLTKLQRQVIQRRQLIAREILGGHEQGSNPYSPHLWLRLPAGWRADAFSREAAHRDVRITEGGAFAVDPAFRPDAVRICLSHETDEGRLKTGLKVLRDILDQPAFSSAMIL